MSDDEKVAPRTMQTRIAQWTRNYMTRTYSADELQWRIKLRNV